MFLQFVIPQKKDIFEFDPGAKVELPSVIVVVKCVLFVLLTFFWLHFYHYCCCYYYFCTEHYS